MPHAWQQSTWRCVWEIDSTRYRSAQIAIYSCHGYVYASLYRTLLPDIKTRHNRSLDSPWGRKMVICLGRWMPDRRRAFIFVLLHDISINIELWERKLFLSTYQHHCQLTLTSHTFCCHLWYKWWTQLIVHEIKQKEYSSPWRIFQGWQNIPLAILLVSDAYWGVTWFSNHCFKTCTTHYRYWFFQPFCLKKS